MSGLKPTQMPKHLTCLRVVGVRSGNRKARLMVGNGTIACAIGRSGLGHLKREGDGTTPIGRFRLLGGYFRPDRYTRSKTCLPIVVCLEKHGWCDDPSSSQYNRPVSLPFHASCEAMHRGDTVYDVVVTLSHNQQPRVKGFGSAIFLHLAHKDYRATAGCIAISAQDMRRLLPRLSLHCQIWIG